MYVYDQNAGKFVIAVVVVQLDSIQNLQSLIMFFACV